MNDEPNTTKHFSPAAKARRLEMALAWLKQRIAAMLRAWRSASRKERRSRRWCEKLARAATLVLLAAGLLLTTGPPMAYANPRTPAFGASSYNPFGLADVGYYSDPAFADLDGDGDLDAFIGEYYGSTIYFPNTGSAINPAFGASSSNPFGLTDVGDRAAPAFADLDADGDLDAFIGEKYGDTFYFPNTGSATSPAFGASSANPFGLDDVGAYATPTFADLDGDGDLDAFIGEYYGSTIYFPNTGSAINPAFGASSSNPFGLTDVAYGNASPAFADLDSDGDLDAFIGEGGGDTTYFPNTGSATSPAFGAPSANPFGLTSVGSLAVPVFVDLDADGDLDALIGSYGGSTIYFPNIGTVAAPAFGASSSNPFGLADVGSHASPTFADLNGDGDLDGFIGENGGNTLYFSNNGSATDPAFKPPLTNPFDLADVGRFASPAFADLDGDGDLDAFIGEGTGNTIYFPNAGSATNPAFGASSSNPFGLTDVGTYASPTFADLNGDGDLDAFIGNNDGNTIYFPNIGSATNPNFKSPLTNPFGLADVGRFASPAFADLDGDGDLDAFIGEGGGNTIYFPNTGSATSPAFGSSSANPFSLVDVGVRANPAFADLDGDGDLEAYVGNDAGDTIEFSDLHLSIFLPLVLRE